MCGIAGWVSYDGDLRAHQDLIRAMTETMARRGPVAGGIWIDWHVGLGHRRLSVIDLAGGLLVQESVVRGEGQVVPYIDRGHRRPPSEQRPGDEIGWTC